jgi:hypothetical protein
MLKAIYLKKMIEIAKQGILHSAICINHEKSEKFLALRAASLAFKQSKSKIKPLGCHPTPPSLLQNPSDLDTLDKMRHVHPEFLDACLHPTAACVGMCLAS